MYVCVSERERVYVCERERVFSEQFKKHVLINNYPVLFIYICILLLIKCCLGLFSQKSKWFQLFLSNTINSI